MTNQQQQLLSNTTGGRLRNSFPIMAQLGILSIIMIGLFGVYIFNALGPHNAPSPQPTEIIQDKNLYPITPQKIEEVSIVAESAFVWDVRGQRILYEKNPDRILPLASVTKLMTALLAHELIAGDKNTVISSDAIRQEGSSGLAPGEVLTAERLREIALISSSNDAAYALAASVGALLGDNDPTQQFVYAMNIKADELDLNSLEFKNTTGLDLTLTEPGAVGSARDVSFLMEHIVSNYPEIIDSTQKPTTRVYNQAGAFHEVSNTNEALNQIPNLLGSKTGYTDLAGGNLTIAFDAGLNRPIIVTVLSSTRNDRFSDVLKLVLAVQESIVKQ